MQQFPYQVELVVKSLYTGHRVYLWCQRNEINYKVTAPYSRDWVYVYNFEDRSTATWFQLEWSDLVITQK